MSETSRRVKHRHVFHIPGYDPIHPRRYRELYRKESAAQGQISGYQIALTPKEKSETYGWSVAAEIDGAVVSANIDMLVWSDIVRDSMAQSIPATYLQLLRTAWLYIVTGTLRRLMWMRKGPVIAALYPVGMLLLQLGLALVLGGLAAGWLGAGVRWLLDMAGLAGGGFARGVMVVTTIAGYVLWAVIAVAVLRLGKRLDGKFFAYYLMHDYAFSASTKGANPPALETRIAAFADEIGNAFNGKADEVLVIGHSSGAHLAVSVLADLLRAGRVPENGPKLALLTLGQVVPMVSFLPKAQRLRRDLAYLAASDRLTWVDVTAPGDGCCFALCDPVAVTGVSPANKRWPLVVSAAFSQTLSPARWKALRWRFFRLHFQYLCAFDQPGDYDYFQITAGPLALSDRYQNRQPSKSRIDVAVSKYTSVLP